MSELKDNQLILNEKEPPFKKLKSSTDNQLNNEQIDLNNTNELILTNSINNDVNLDNKLDNDLNCDKQVNDLNCNEQVNDLNCDKQVNDLNCDKQVNDLNCNEQVNDLNCNELKNDVNLDNKLDNDLNCNEPVNYLNCNEPKNNLNYDKSEENSTKTSSEVNLNDKNISLNGLNNESIDLNNLINETNLNLDNNNNCNSEKDLNNTICKSNMNYVNEPIFELNWITKNKLVFNLSRYSQLLHTQSIDEKLKAELIKENNYLVCSIMNLMLKSTNKNLETKEIQDKNVDNRTLDIKLSIRNIILNNLIKNHNSTIMYLNTTSKETKKELINENNNLINILTNLPSSKDIEEPEFDDFELFKQTELTSGKKMEYLQRIKEDLRNELKQEILDTIQKTIRDRAEINLTFKFNVKELMNTKEMISGDTFYCRGLPWTVQAQFKKDGAFLYLGLYVHCLYASKEKWSISTKIRLILLNIAGFKEVEYTFFYPFTAGISCGLPKFITHQSLLNQSKGYVKDDSFYVTCNLLAENLIIN